MKIFQNKQDFFQHIHRQVVLADDPTSPDNRAKHYANIYSEIRNSAHWGMITNRDYINIHSAVKMAEHDMDRDQIDIFGEVR